MKKIVLILLLGLAYQSTISATATTIELVTLGIANTVSQLKLQNTAATSQATISSISEDTLAAAITTETKIPLYQESDIPYGWGAAGLVKDLLLLLGGYPNPNGYYIQGAYVYKSDGTILGKYKATLISEATATSSGWSCASDSEGGNLYLRVAEKNGFMEADAASDLLMQSFLVFFDYSGGTYAVASESAQAPYTSTYKYSDSVTLNTVQQNDLGDTYFLQIYIDTSDTNATS